MKRNEDVVIRVSSLDKCYEKQDSHSAQLQTFYALKDISFEVNRGEVLGVIGNNGSGKSTLLRVLSGITRPTDGKVEIFGMPSSILDVGTGIHPDLTGRENTYLRGQLLGMDKTEVTAVFDELVRFSGVEEFMDTPVKHYSSGMFLRLAFSIIVHLRSEILFLDEVLAVGDASFRRKCAAKINDIVEKGCTVVLVSHDMGTVMETCTKAMLLEKGKMVGFGSPKDIVQNSYMASLVDRNSVGMALDRPMLEEIQSSDYGFKVDSFCLYRQNGNEATSFESREEVIIRLEYTIVKDNINLAIGITDVMDGRLMDDSPVLELSKNERSRCGKYKVTWTIPSGLFNAGTYFIGLYALSDNLRILKIYSRVIQFKITDESVPENVQEFYRSAFKVDLNMKVERVEL